MQQIDTSESEYYIPSTMSLPFGQKFIQYGNWFYIGEVRNGKPNGKGKFFSKDGSWEEGEYKNSSRIGSGIIKSAGMMYIGEWSSKGAEGEGTLLYTTQQDEAVYFGQFFDGTMHGEGILSFKNGSWYKGDWENGDMNGDGVYYSAVYNRTDTGQFRDGYRKGSGVIKWANGDRYEGTWDDSTKKLNGVGFMYLSNGDIDIGKWVDDKWVDEQNVKDTEMMPKYPFDNRFSLLLMLIPWIALIVTVILRWISKGFWTSLLVAGIGAIIAFLSMFVLLFGHVIMKVEIKKLLINLNHRKQRRNNRSYKL
jgi:hypothetical protein